MHSKDPGANFEHPVRRLRRQGSVDPAAAPDRAPDAALSGR